MATKPTPLSPKASSPKRMKGGVDETHAINTIRMLGAEMPSAGKSGHPGAPMGCAPMAHVLWKKVMKYNPKNPDWVNRDRFTLSNGHACALQYAMLHLTGYDLSLDDLKSFRKINSKTPGHPENFCTPGVEVCTGPLGQGISNAVGLAAAEAHLAAVFNREGFPIVDNYTFVICGDGCLQEGVSSEASSLAGHLGLGKLILLYDDNEITIDGRTSLSFTENVLMRYEAYGWHTQTVTDGNTDSNAIFRAVEAAKAVKDKPSIIKIKTIIGFGSAKENTAGVHGAPLTGEDLANVKKKFGFDPEKSFQISPEIASYYNHEKEGAEAEKKWDDLFAKYTAKYPDLAAEFTRRVIRKELPTDWKKVLPRFKPGDKAMATRQLSELCLNALAPILPELIGGSADLTHSNLTALKCSGDFQKKSYDGRYFRFGVREHGMAAFCNGLFTYGGIIPFCATFLNFITYAWGAVRLSALSKYGIIYVMTHDSIGLGEDGPTHQPIETLALLRATPELYTFRPADGNEVSGSYMWAVEHRHKPSVLALSRQGLPQLEGSNLEKVYKGAYVLKEYGTTDGKELDVILVATGSEVALAVEAAKLLKNQGKKSRVVSMPCTTLFEEASEDYRRSVFPEGIPVLSVEAAHIFGWSRYAHDHVGMTTFGASGPIADVYAKFGMTAANIMHRANSLVEFYAEKPVPALLDEPPQPRAPVHH